MKNNYFSGEILKRRSPFYPDLLRFGRVVIGVATMTLSSQVEAAPIIFFGLDNNTSGSFPLSEPSKGVKP